MGKLAKQRNKERGYRLYFLQSEPINPIGFVQNKYKNKPKFVEENLKDGYYLYVSKGIFSYKEYKRTVINNKNYYHQTSINKIFFRKIGNTYYRLNGFADRRNHLNHIRRGFLSEKEYNFLSKIPPKHLSDKTKHLIYLYNEMLMATDSKMDFKRAML